MMRYFRVLSFALVTSACSPSTPATLDDASSHEAASPVDDSSLQSEDAASPLDDAIALTDSAVVEDAASPVMDATNPMADSSTPPSDGGGASPGALSGTITRWPVRVSAPSVETSRLPLIAVWFSSDAGQTWWMMDSRCNGGEAVRITNGQIELRSTSCTSSANRYQIRIEPAVEHRGAALPRFPFTVAIPSVSVAALPQMRVYMTTDNVTWYSQHGNCGTAQSFYVSDGSVQLRSNYCNMGATAYQIAIAPATDAARQSSPRYPATINRPIDLGRLPFVTAYWNASTLGWFSTHGQCVGGYNISLTATGARLSGDYCTTGHDYAVSFTP